MPRNVTMISYKLNCKEDGFVSPIIIVEPVRVAMLTMGVAVELNEYEQSEHSAGRELTEIRKVGV